MEIGCEKAINTPNGSIINSKIINKQKKYDLIGLDSNKYELTLCDCEDSIEFKVTSLYGEIYKNKKSLEDFKNFHRVFIGYNNISEIFEDYLYDIAKNDIVIAIDNNQIKLVFLFAIGSKKKDFEVILPQEKSNIKDLNLEEKEKEINELKEKYIKLNSELENKQKKMDKVISECADEKVKTEYNKIFHNESYKLEEWNHFQSHDPGKVVFVGEPGVGKTSLIIQLLSNKFSNEVMTSMATAFRIKSIYLKDIDDTINFKIWDTAGQEKYRSLTRIFYKDAEVIAFVYDITNKLSFKEIKKYWYKDAKENTDSVRVIALVANKSDLINKIEVSESEGQKYADKIGAIFQTTSSMDNKGIKKLFKNIGKKLIDPSYDYKNPKKISIKNKNIVSKSKPSNNNNIKLNSKSKEVKKKSYC